MILDVKLAEERVQEEGWRYKARGSKIVKTKRGIGGRIVVIILD